MTRDEEIARLEDRLAELRAERDQDEEWPKPGDAYWLIDSAGRLCCSVWDGDMTHVCRKEVGNIFRTEAKAKIGTLRLQARRKMLKFGGHEGMDRFPTNPAPELAVWIPYVSKSQKRPSPMDISVPSPFDVWFYTREACSHAIDYLSDEEAYVLCHGELPPTDRSSQHLPANY